MVKPAGAGGVGGGVESAGGGSGSSASGNTLDITLVESPDVPTIGVGEGTWPTMRDTLRRIGVSERAFLRECDASFKQGTRFIGWRGGDPSEHYYHPFSLPCGFPQINAVPVWQRHAGRLSFAAAVSPQEAICEQSLAPKQAQTPEFAAVVNYAYHLDAAKFGAFLRRHCVERLGVRHVSDHARDVALAPDGSVASLHTDRHGSLAADLFIDCSGAAARLLVGQFQTPRLECRDVLFNDRALAAQVPYANADDPIASATLSTALRAGWVWDIALPTRRGVGYVYSSAHCDDAEAEADLRAYLRRSLGDRKGSGGGSSGGNGGADGRGSAAVDAVVDKQVESLELRRLQFEPGHLQTFWHKNCVAIGMASGFIEPLEASALVMVELAAATVRDELPLDPSVMDIVAARFNERFRYRWERVIDFLKLHYVLSQREDSDYWRDHRRPATIPPRLQELLALWRFRAPSRLDLFQADEVFPAASYQYILYGMGFRTECGSGTRPNEREDVVIKQLEENAKQTRQMLAGLPPNRDLLARWTQG